MIDETLTFSFAYTRAKTLKQSAIDQNTALRVMPGFSNHILWQLGHIYVIAENINEAVGNERSHSDKWWQLFRSGTSPMETPAEMWPDVSEVLQSLKDQHPILEKAIRHADPAVLSSLNPNPAPHRPYTVKGWIIHTIRHEALHLGAITMMRNIIERTGQSDAQ